MSSKIDLTSVDDLAKYIVMNKPTFVVLCGFDNVGKGRVLRELETHPLFPQTECYRPDYEYWSPRLPQPFRWTIFMSFLDVLNKFNDKIKLESPLVFDRSALCGAVYNDDASIARDYAKKIQPYSNIHVLVTCGNKENYEKLLEVRGSETSISYEDYLVYTERYRCYLEAFEIPYMEFVNIYDDKIGEELSCTCGGCSHYKPITNIGGKGFCDLHHVYVYKGDDRCDRSSEPDIQDKEERK